VRMLRLERKENRTFPSAHVCVYHLESGRALCEPANQERDARQAFCVRLVRQGNSRHRDIK